jgi:hypothetical protein
LIPFFALFAIIGSISFVAWFLIPCFNVARARNWTPLPCKIISSAVASRGSGKDLRYYPDVLFSYSLNGQNYSSTRYCFFKLGFKNTYQPQSLLSAYPQGAAATCYVDPHDTTQAVLNRNFQPAAFASLLSLVFVAIGLGGVTWQVLARRVARRNEGLGHRSWRPKGGGAAVAGSTSGMAQSSPETVVRDGTGQVVLKPVSSPGGQACGMMFVALFWNGIVAVFLRMGFFEAHDGGFMRIFLGLFLIPFVLIGLGLLVAALASFGAMFVPRPTLTANVTDIPLGGTVELQWRTRRGVLNPQKLQLRLEAREEATYTRGTRTYTDRNIFLSQSVFESAPGGEQSGQSRVAIPAGTMHSFEAAHNKIVWAIKVKGDVPLWPNFEDEYRLTVLPAPCREYSSDPTTPSADSSSS